MMPLSALKRVEATFVYNRHEEYVDQEGREHVPLTKTLFHSESPRAHPVVEPHACLHAIVELTNDLKHIMWHTKTGEYCPEEGSINGVVRFGKVDKAYVERNSFFRASSCNRRITNIISVVERVGRKPFCSSGRILARSSLRWRAMIFSSISPACATDASVVAALCPVLLFIEYHDDGTISLLRHLASPPNTNDDIEPSPAQGQDPR